MCVSTLLSPSKVPGRCECYYSRREIQGAEVFRGGRNVASK